MAILPKGSKPDTFGLHNSLKLSFTYIRSLRSNFVECESFLESNSPDILAICETNLDDSIDSGNFCERLSSFNPKRFCYSYAWSCSLCERRSSFYMGLISRKLWRFLCFRLPLLHSSVLLLFPLSGVDSGQFWHWHTNFGDVEFGHPNSIIVVQKNNNVYLKMFFLLILTV